MAIWRVKNPYSIVYYWDLLYELVKRALKVQYEGTILGFAWTLIMPFLQLGILTFPLLILIVILEEHNIPVAVILMPLIMAVQFILCLGLGYLVAILSVIFRDTGPILDTLLRLFMFLSPVFYGPQLVPEQYLGLYNLNPLVTILQSYRDIILHGIMPQLFPLTIVAIFLTAILCLGFWILKNKSYRFLEEL